MKLLLMIIGSAVIFILASVGAHIILDHLNHKAIVLDLTKYECVVWTLGKQPTCDQWAKIYPTDEGMKP